MNMYVHGKEMPMPETDDDGNEYLFRDRTWNRSNSNLVVNPDVNHSHAVAERWAITRLGVDVYQMKQVEGPRRELPRIHELKIDQHNLSALLSGRKKCEIRDNDREFKTGEFLFLRETQRTNIEMKAHGLPLNYTGRVALFEITHIQTGYGLPSWLVAMSVNELARAF